MADDDDDAVSQAPRVGEPALDESRADARALALRENGHGRQGERLVGRGDAPHGDAAEEDVTHDVLVVRGHEAQLRDERRRPAQRRDQARLGRLAERQLEETEHLFVICRQLRPDRQQLLFSPSTDCLKRLTQSTRPAIASTTSSVPTASFSRSPSTMAYVYPAGGAPILIESSAEMGAVGMPFGRA